LRLALAGYVLFACAYFGAGSTWNPVSRFCLTRAVVEQRSFEITPYVASTGDRAKVGERYYTDKAPVPSMLAVPGYAVFYALARAGGHAPEFELLPGADARSPRLSVNTVFRYGLWVSSATTAGIAAALLAVAIFEVLRRRAGVLAGTAGALATVFGTPLLPYATSFFGHTVAAAFLFGAFALVETGPDRLGRRWLLAGASLGLGCGSEYVVAVPAAILAGYLVLNREPGTRWRAASSLALGAALPLAFLAVYHGVCFGAPWRTGYGFIVRPAFASGHAQGLLGITYPKLEALFGILIGRSRGLFYVAPFTAVAIAAVVVGYFRRRERVLLVVALVVGSLLWINASYYMWTGGWATGPRHVVPALGFLGLGAGLAFSWSNAWRRIAVVIACLSALSMILTTAVGLETPPKLDAIFDYLVPQLRAGKIARQPGASNLGLELGLGRRASVIPLLTWLSVGAWWLTERARSIEAARSASAPEHSRHGS